jgi:hypothetical protein
MADKLPWMMFFVSDYMNERTLRKCPLEAKAIYPYILCEMHRSHRRGYLQDRHGRPFTAADVSDLAGVTLDEALLGLEQLKANEVVSVTRNGVIFSRRMDRETALAKKRSAAGKKGGIKSSENRFAQAKVQPNTQASSECECDSDSSLEELGGAGERETAPRAPPAESGGFTVFWKAFPMHANEDGARAEWAALNPSVELQATILLAIGRQKLSSKWQRGVYTHADRWLREQRWKDDLPSVNGSATRPPETPEQRMGRILTQRVEREKEAKGSLSMEELRALIPKPNGRVNGHGHDKEPPVETIADVWQREKGNSR